MMNDNQVPNHSKQSDLTKEFYLMLADATAKGVSEIHIEVMRTSACVRYVIDGKSSADMRFWQGVFAVRFVHEIQSIVGQRIKSDDLETPDYYQMESADLLVNDEPLRIKTITTPSHDGLDCIMRLLPLDKETGSAKVLTLNDLGYQDKHIDLLKRPPEEGVIINSTQTSFKANSASRF